MKKIEKISMLISIVLISMLALSAVSAAEDTAAADDADVVALEEVQAIDNTQTNDDVSYESTDIIVNTTGDSGDLAVSKNAKATLNDGDTKSFSQLATDVATNPAMLSGASYKYDPDTDSAYVDGITLTNGITIIGGGATIDGANTARIFNIPEGVSVTLMNLNLINGAATEGAAIYNSGKLTLMSSKVNDNTAVQSGAGIYNNKGEVLVTSCEFDGNDLSSRNTNGWGGAAIYSDEGTVTINDTNITNNLKDIVHRGGTGIYTGDLSSAAVTSKDGSLTVNNSRFESNSGSYGGAILAQGGTLLVNGTTFENNFAFNGGAIDIINADYTITDSKFYNNDAKGTGSTNSNYANGGAICAQDTNNQGLISSCEFEGNTAAIGGAISSENTVITDSTLTNNNAYAANSENYNGKVNNRGGFGGAIYNDGTVTIDGSTFTDNIGRGRGLDLKNAEISDSSFTNTIINVNNKGTVEVSNNEYDNDGKDISSASGCTVIVNVEDGDVPYVTSGTIIFNGDLTFQDLQDIIDAGNSAITLSGNVIKSADEYTTFADGLTINHAVTIYGTDYYIQADDGKIFNVAEGSTLSLRNATLKGSGETAITNYGSVSLVYGDTNQFIDCGDVLIDNHGALNTNTISTFTQLSYYVSLVNGGEIYLGSTAKVTKTEEEKETFANGIVIEKDLTIRGYYTATKIYDYIDADNSGRIFTVNEGKTLSLKGFNLTKGNAADGGAVYLAQGASLNANTVNFLQNTATYSGGAIYATGATVNIDNCTLDSNQVTDFTKNNDTGGAAIHAEDSTVTIANSKVTNNGDTTLDRTTGDLVCGVVNLIDSDLTVTDSVFENNTGIYGGAITIQAPSGEKSLSITGSNFTGNNAYDGAAIHMEKNIKYDIKDTIFDENNKAAGEGSPGYCAGGGALFIKGSEGTLDKVTIKGSQAAQGGAIDIENSKATITNSVFESNTATGWGGAIAATGDSALTVTDSTFKDNTAAAATIVVFDTATADINANFTDNYDTYNWGVVTVYGTGDVNIADSNFTKNVEDTYTVDVYVVDDAKVSVKDSRFDTNSYYSIVATDGKLDLSGNNIQSAYVPIYTVADGAIISEVKSTILANDTYNWHMADYDLFASLTDDMGNPIRDANFNFVLNKDGLEEAISIPATFDGTTFKYTATFTPTEIGEYLISLDYPVEEVATSVIKVSRSWSDLASLIANDEDGIIDLDGNYDYITEFDSALVNGIVIDKAVTINGNDYILNASDLARIFKVESAGDLTLNGVTLANAAVTDNGAAIYSLGAVTANNAVFIDNKITAGTVWGPGAIAAGGAAIFSYTGSSLSLTGTNFINNDAVRDGWNSFTCGAVYVSGAASALIDKCLFENNSGVLGGALTFENFNQETVTIKNSTFKTNDAWQGGAININENVPYMLITGTTFIGNTATAPDAGSASPRGGAISMGTRLYSTDATFSGCTFKDNIADTDGGAIVVSTESKLNVDTSAFENNKANNGGAIYFHGTSATIASSTFTGNDPEKGGALYVSAGEVLVKENTEFIENSADYGGAVYVAADATFIADKVLFKGNTATDNGGAIWSDGTVTITDSTFEGNDISARHTSDEFGGAAIYSNANGVLGISHSIVKDNNPGYTNGDQVYGAITVFGTATITNVNFTNNKGRWGGAIGSYGYGTGTLTVKDSNFDENSAYQGGAIFAQKKELIVDNCNFTSNSATDGGAIDHDSQKANGYAATISNSNFNENIATRYGSVILALSQFTYTACNFTENTAATGTTTIHYMGTNYDAAFDDSIIADCRFEDNTANYYGAIYFYGTKSLTVTGSNFTSNAGTAHSGAILFHGDTLTVYNDIFTSNSGRYTGGIYIDSASAASIKNSIFDNNNGAAKYYNIYQPTGLDLTLEDNTFKTLVANNVTVETDKENYAYGENVTVNGTFDWGVIRYEMDVPFTFTKDGQTLVGAPELEGFTVGTYTKKLTGLNPGLYTIGFETFTDANGNQYVIDANPATFTVEKATPSIEIIANDTGLSELPMEVTVNVTDVNGDPIEGLELVVIIDGVEYSITTLESGTDSFTLSGLDIKNYTAVAFFAGNDVYTSAFGYKDFSILDTPIVTVSIEDIDFGEDAIIVAGLETADGEKLDGVVEVTIGETTYIVAVADGLGTLNIAALDADTYTYTAVSRANGNYLAAGPTDTQTFTVSAVEAFIDFHHRVTEIGEEGVIFGGISVIEEIDEEGNPHGEEYIDSTFTLIFSDEEGTVLTLEGLFTDDEGAIALPGTEDLDLGTYTVKVILDDKNYNLAEDTFEFEVTPKSAQVGVDLEEIDIEEGQTTTIHITVGEGQVWAFTSYGDEDGEIKYGTGTVLVVDDDDEWTKVVVLTNDADESYVGQEFYIRSDARFWGTEELYADEGETFTGIYIIAHPSGVVPQDIDGTATITIRNDDGDVVNVIENVEIKDGKGEYELPVLPIGEYYFTVTVDADGYDLEPAEFYDCLVVMVKEGTYTHLQQIINEGINDEDRYNDEDNSVWIDLDIDFAFDPDYDAALVGGVVIDSDKLVKINGNDHTISGSDLARIFSITAGTQVELMNVVLANGAVTDNGAAIYNLGELYVHDATFKDNKVTQGTVWGPGAIAAGGAAIFSYTGSTLIVDNSEFLNNEALHGLYNSFTCGAIYVSGAEKVVIANSKFENNAAVLGGAITIEDYTVDEAYANSDDYEATIHDCEFNNNLAWQGGAINVNEKVPYLDIDFCNFNENKAVDPNSGSSVPTGGAISVGTHNYGTKLGLYHCNFDDNSALNTGGAIALMNEACELGMNECNFNDNTAAKGGAIYFYGESAEIHNSYFNGNDPEYGGALYIAAGDVSIDNTNFDENIATQGGAIFVANGAGLDLEQCNFYKNTADEGSAIYATYDSSLTMKNCNFDENVATGNYGTVALGSDNAVIDQTNFNNNKGGNGAAIFWTGDNGKITNSNFWRNEATEGFSGGAIFAFGDNIEIDNCDFNENTADVHGGAIAWINQGLIGGHEGTVSNSRFNNNKAGNSGGAIYWTGESGTVDNCDFYNNEATANGAAIISTGSDMTIKDSRFDNNKAASDGAIYFAGNDADLIGDSFTNGQATMGAIVLDGASISVDKSFFEANNGMPVHYNILNSGTIESITDTTFRFIDPTIVLDNTYTYGDEITMTGTFDWGVQQPAITMKFTINGNEMETTVLDGKYTFPIDIQLDPDTYTVVIKSFTDANGNNYILNTAEHTFVVEKATPILEVEGDDYLMPGETATVGITLTGVLEEGVAGIVIVTVDGKKYIVATDENGEGSVDIDGLANGKYPIVADFIGNDKYGIVSNTTEFIEFYYKSATFDIVIDDVTYGDVINVIVENATDLEGNPLSGMVFGNIYDANGVGAGLVVMVEDGSGTATVRKLDAGEYNVVATFTDEEYEYISEEKQFTLNVDKAQSTLEVIFADGEFTIALDGVAGEKLNESVAVMIDGVAYDAQVTDNGTITFPAPDLAVGRHTVEVAFAGNHNYLGDIDSYSFDIPKATPVITVTGDEIEEGDDATITVTVMDGQTGVDGIAQVTVNNVNYAVTISEDGTGRLTISDLLHGNYPIAATFLGNDNYMAADYEGEEKVVVNTDTIYFDLEVDTEDKEIVVSNAKDAEGEAVDGTIEAVVLLDNVEVATLSNDLVGGEGSIDISDLEAGNYTVIVTVRSQDHNLMGQDEADFTIELPTMSFNYSIAEAVYGDELYIDITDAMDEDENPVSGTVKVYYNDEVIGTATVEDGSGTVAIPDLEPGVYDFVIVLESEGYETAGDLAIGIVNKADSDVSIVVNPIVYGAKPTIDIELVSGKDAIDDVVSVSINGVEIGNYTTSKGKVSVPVATVYDAGTYTVCVQFAGNDNYDSSAALTTFEVSKATPVITVASAKEAYDYGEDAELDISVKVGAKVIDGIVAVNVNGVGYYVNVTGGKGKLHLEDLANGTYDVEAQYIESDNYAQAVSKAVSFTVNPSTEATVKVTLPEEAPEYGDDATISVAVTDGAGNAIPVEAVNVTINNVTKEYPVDENGTVNLGKLPAGENEITVSFDDGVHTAVEETATATVKPAIVDITVTADKEEATYGEAPEVTINATDKNGNPIDAKAAVAIDGSLVDYVDIVNGTAQISIEDLGVGTHNIAVSVIGENYSADSVAVNTITVSKATPTIRAQGDTVEWGESSTVAVTVTGVDNAKLDVPVVVRVSWIVSGSDQLIDVEKGIGEAVFDLSKYVGPGTYDIDVIFLGNDEYEALNVTAKLTLTEPKAVTMTTDVSAGEYGQATNVTVGLADASGKVLEGETVTVLVDGKEYANATIGEDGFVTVPVEGLDVGEHTIAVKFDDGTHDPAEDEVNVTVDKASDATVDVKINTDDNITLDVDVKDANNNSLNGTIIVYVDGEPYANATVGGNESTNIPMGDIPSGDHTIEVVFVNPNYGSTNYTAEFTKYPLLTEITVKVDKSNIVYGDGDITATVTLTSEDKPIDGVVEILIDGEPQNLTVNNGKATITFKDLAAGHYTVVSNFAGNATYAPSSDSVFFNVDRKATKLLFNNMNTTAFDSKIDGRIGEYFYFQLVDIDGNPVAGKNVSIGFNGRVYNRTTNETGWAKLQINLKVAIAYTFAISFLGDDNYTGDFQVALIKVNPQTPKLTTSSKTYKASAKTKSLTATFKTKAGNPVSGKKVTFTVNGKSYSATTNAKGVATVKVSLTKKGTYSFTAKVAKDNTYAAVSKSAKLTIK